MSHIGQFVAFLISFMSEIDNNYRFVSKRVSQKYALIYPSHFIVKTYEIGQILQKTLLNLKMSLIQQIIDFLWF